jgi:GMP synthase (glutamine-hydrolysing)
MLVTAIRHVPFEDLSAFAPALERRGIAYRYFDVGADNLGAFDPLAPDVLIILGGPIGVYQEEKYPFLIPETQAIAKRLAAGRPTLGVCLGSQLMAKALGARVYPAGYKEIGFGPIELNEAGRASCLAPFADDPITLHWHGDTFDLPDGATLLASSALCERQAFSLGPNILGVQFHPEDGGVKFERWLIGHTAELSAAGIDVAQLRADSQTHGERLGKKADAVLGAWLEGLKP